MHYAGDVVVRSTCTARGPRGAHLQNALGSSKAASPQVARDLNFVTSLLHTLCKWLYGETDQFRQAMGILCFLNPIEYCSPISRGTLFSPRGYFATATRQKCTTPQPAGGRLVLIPLASSTTASRTTA